jgi:serine/threonine protein phosphatase PrpC
MGGHAAGDIASDVVIQSLETIGVVDKINDASGLVASAILKANSTLRYIASERGKDIVIGATVVAAVARGDRLAILWAGDSRAYRLRGNHFEQLTHDHDILTDMKAQNAPTELIAAMKSNIISRAVGAHDKLNLDEIRIEVNAGDVYLLCSDGLYREVPDQQIKAMLRETDPDRSADLLIQAALRAGARDNITVVVMRAGSEER